MHTVTSPPPPLLGTGVVSYRSTGDRHEFQVSNQTSLAAENARMALPLFVHSRPQTTNRDKRRGLRGSKQKCRIAKGRNKTSPHVTSQAARTVYAAARPGAPDAITLIRVHCPHSPSPPEIIGSILLIFLPSRPYPFLSSPRRYLLLRASERAPRGACMPAAPHPSKPFPFEPPPFPSLYMQPPTPQTLTQSITHSQKHSSAQAKQPVAL